MLLALLAFVSVVPAHAKRGPIPKIEAIKIGGQVVRHLYVIGEDEFTMYLVRRDATEELWRTELYRERYHHQVSRCLQDTFLKSMKLEGGIVIAVDEIDRAYRVDVNSGELLFPEQAHGQYQER